MILLLASGALAGLLAGFLGIGGGIIYVPVLFYLLPESSFKAQAVVGSSCAAKAIISLSSIYRHRKEKNISFDFYPLFIGGIVGGLLGANISSTISTDVLQSTIAVVIGLVGLYKVSKVFMKSSLDSEKIHRKANPWLYVIGGIVGTIAGGIGGTGGAITVPILLNFYNFPIKRAAGTSSVMVFGLSLASAIVYVIRGNIEGVGGVFGFIDIKAVLLLAITAIPAAQLGAYLHRFGRPKVFYFIFSIVLLAVAYKLWHL